MTKEGGLSLKGLEWMALLPCLSIHGRCAQCCHTTCQFQCKKQWEYLSAGGLGCDKEGLRWDHKRNIVLKWIRTLVMQTLEPRIGVFVLLRAQSPLSPVFIYVLNRSCCISASESEILGNKEAKRKLSLIRITGKREETIWYVSNVAYWRPVCIP